MKSVGSRQKAVGRRKRVRKASSRQQAAGRTRRVAKEIWEFLGQDKFAEALGIKLLDLREGYAKCAMVVGDNMVNAHQIAHGAAIFTIADFAFAAACNSYGQTALALEVKINFLEAVKAGTKLIAEAKEEALSNRIGLYHLTVKDARGVLVAVAQATAYRKQEWFVGASKQGNR